MKQSVFAAAVIGTLLIVATTAIFFSYPNQNSSSLAHSTSSLSTNSTSTETSITISSSTHSSLHRVTFQQTGACSGWYTAPWSVTLGNETKVEPANGIVPTQGQGYLSGPTFKNYSTIVFAVPNGRYSYHVSPSAAFGQPLAGPASGVVIVNGADVTVSVIGPYEMSCGSVTTTATSSNTTTTDIPTNMTSTSVSPLSSIVIGTVAIDGLPWGVSVNPITNMAYVIDGFANRLTVINISSRTVITTITLPATSSGIAVDPRLDRVYVALHDCINMANVTNSCNSGSPSSLKPAILEIDGRTNSIVASLPINAGQLKINPNTGTLYGLSGDNVIIIDGESGSIVGNVSLNAYLLGIAVNPSDNLLYVSACKDSSLVCIDPRVMVINGTTHLIQARISVAANILSWPVVDASTDTVYVVGTQYNTSVLFAIDGRSEKVIRSFDIASSCAGIVPDFVYTNHFYAHSEGGLTGFFLVIDGTNGRFVNMFSVGGRINGVAFDATGQQTYITGQSQSDTSIPSLLILPARIGQGGVNTKLLPQGVCLP